MLDVAAGAGNEDTLAVWISRSDAAGGIRLRGCYLWPSR